MVRYIWSLFLGLLVCGVLLLMSGCGDEFEKEKPEINYPGRCVLKHQQWWVEEHIRTEYCNY